MLQFDELLIKIPLQPSFHLAQISMRIVPMLMHLLLEFLLQSTQGFEDKPVGLFKSSYSIQANHHIAFFLDSGPYASYAMLVRYSCQLELIQY